MIVRSKVMCVCLVADYHRSMSVPIKVHVEDVDADTCDLSSSLDLRRTTSALRMDDIAESPPTTSGFLPLVLPLTKHTHAHTQHIAHTHRCERFRMKN